MQQLAGDSGRSGLEAGLVHGHWEPLVPASGWAPREPQLLAEAKAVSLRQDPSEHQSATSLAGNKNGAGRRADEEV